MMTHCFPYLFSNMEMEEANSVECPCFMSLAAWGSEYEEGQIFAAEKI